jgi:hypothetical protein
MIIIEIITKELHTNNIKNAGKQMPIDEYSKRIKGERLCHLKILCIIRK